MAHAIKQMVSKKKCRYKEGKFNFDLTYISSRIIAMGYPAEKLEAVYRNDCNEVKEFLDQKHGAHYWVYNLCSEKDRNYDKKKFDGRVSCYAFDDHHPPVFSLIQPFCDEVKQYLEADERNTAVVHCKAGKGRTGVMICCYLLFCQQSPNAESVLRYYADKRTTDQKGVTIPSQRRYITYYDAMNRRGLEYKPVKLYLRDIVLDPAPNFTGQTNVFVEVTQRGRREPYISKHVACRKNDRSVSISINPPLLLSEDVKFEFSSKPKFDIKLSRDKLFHFWLNTFFVDMELEGGLAHDLTGHTPIVCDDSGSGRGHVHHASGSSEDSSTDDIPLKPPSSSNGSGAGHCVTFREQPALLRENGSSNAHRQTSMPIGPLGNGNAVNAAQNDQPASEVAAAYLMKNASISDEHLQDRRKRQNDFTSKSSHISSMGPLSTSDENSVASCVTDNSSDSTNNLSQCTTTESFNQQRLRHVSMPQARVSSSSAGPSGPGHPAQAVQHSHLEASLSSEVNQHKNPFFSRSSHHAAITSNSAASLEANNHCTITGVTGGMGSSYAGSGKLPQIPIPGKLLSLRLKKAQIDKAHKDKQCQKFPENFSVTLFLVKPEDQSETCLDYSLYGPALFQAGQAQGPILDTYSTITTRSAYCSNDSKFTVVAINGPNNPASGGPTRPMRTRPLTGESGASSSSATPSLKSMDQQSSQDSVASSDEEISSLHTKFLTSVKSSTANSSSKDRSNPVAKQPPQSTAI